MSNNINISLGNSRTEIAIPYSVKTNIDIAMPSGASEVTLGVNNFPAFVDTPILAHQLSVYDTMYVNIISQRLLRDVDLLLLANIDTIPLSQLDIGQNKTVYSI